MFRWFALAIVSGCLGISIYHRRRARLEAGTIPRRDERPAFVAARLIVGLPLWLAILAYLVNPAWTEWASLASPEWLRWTGVGLGFLTVPMAYWVFRSLGRNVSETVLTKPSHQLVTHGPYRWIRHPLYSMGIALVFAIGLMAENWFILLIGLVALLGIRTVVVPVEEAALVDTFGDEYRDYMATTGRLLPRIGVPFRRGRAP
jgi:protein-S-isoprenylcysteine O-methyltransferase Ste14